MLRTADAPSRENELNRLCIVELLDALTWLPSISENVCGEPVELKTRK